MGYWWACMCGAEKVEEGTKTSEGVAVGFVDMGADARVVGLGRQ